jgi:hypothetical protein
VHRLLVNSAKVRRLLANSAKVRRLLANSAKVLRKIVQHSLFLLPFFMSPPPMTAAVAACIVLGYDSNIAANHDLAMMHMKEMDFVPVYTHDSNPVHPTAVSTKVQQVNPYVYLTYPTEGTGIFFSFHIEHLALTCFFSCYGTRGRRFFPSPRC